MNLSYTDIQDLQISENGVRLHSINSIIRKLLQNDGSFFGSNIIPAIWERRWYTDRLNKDLYYQKGDAVWINTEQAEQFISIREADIKQYAMEYPKSAAELARLSAVGDTDGIYQLYKDMALGRNGYDSIYYIGNLLDHAQIKISKIDYNDKEPYLSDYWEDFFDEKYRLDYYKDAIRSEARQLLSSAYDTHLREYHLSGIQDIDTLYSRYLQKDLSNIKSLQKFYNHAWYQRDMTGLDYVQDFKVQRLDHDQCRWFRLWKSGLLEHGGVVNVSCFDMGSNDTDHALYTVEFGWPYDDGQTAPVYNYPSIGVGSFYSRDDGIFTGYGNGLAYQGSYQAVGSEKRYIVDVSPAKPTDPRKPYPALSCDRFTRYPGKDVTQMNNGSFTFLYNRGLQEYSYYVKGFVVKNA